MRLLLASLLLLVSLPLRADGFSTTVRAPRQERPEPQRRVDLRVGISSTASRPVLCGYASPFERVGIEACGTGAGFLHDDPEPELARFRTLWKLGAWSSPLGWVQARLALGFAELQLVGADSPGFFFGGTDPLRVETAGPEAGLSLQLFEPLGGGVQLVGDLALGVAYLRWGDALREPQGRWHGAVTFTLGAGF